MNKTWTTVAIGKRWINGTYTITAGIANATEILLSVRYAVGNGWPDIRSSWLFEASIFRVYGITPDLVFAGKRIMCIFKYTNATTITISESTLGDFASDTRLQWDLYYR